MKTNERPTKKEEITRDNIKYSFDENEKTAELVSARTEFDITIPRSVQHNNQIFIIKSIGNQAFAYSHIKSIQFSSDSELRSIHKKAFQNSRITNLTLPSSVLEFGKGWCKNVSFLTNITIIPTKEPNILYYNDKFIIGKSSSKSDTYDVLYFARRDVKEATIPSFIKQIAPYAFENCESLKTLNFADNSELQIIDKKAFRCCLIQSVAIPSHVTKISHGAFKDCCMLSKIEITPNSELQIIGKYAFDSTQIEFITIPSHVTKIGKEAFVFTKLRKLEVTQDSELKIIENGAFCGSEIESLTIPSDIELREGWCRQTSKLNEIRIHEREKRNILYYENKFLIGKSDAESETFDLLLFARRNIKTTTVPPFIKKIGYAAFFSCEKLISVFINSQIETIGKSAFNDCRKLAKIEIQNDSKLQEICKYAFVGCKIESFSIPPLVKSIGYHSFSDCRKLRIFEVESEDSSELKISDLNDALGHSNEILMAPKNFFE